MKKYWNRILILCCMLISLLSASALASDTTSVSTLHELKTALANGATNITLTDTICITEGNVVLTASSPVVITTTTKDAFTVTGGTLTLGKNITITAEDTILYATESGEIIIDGAELNLTDSYNRLALIDGEGASLTVNSGILSSLSYRYAVTAQYNAKLYVNGGMITSATQRTIDLLGAAIHVTGGILDGYVVASNIGGTNGSYTSKLTATGGKFSQIPSGFSLSSDLGYGMIAGESYYTIAKKYRITFGSTVSAGVGSSRGTYGSIATGCSLSKTSAIEGEIVVFGLTYPAGYTAVVTMNGETVSFKNREFAFQMPACDVSLKAAFSSANSSTQYTITFDSNGGSNVPDQKVRYTRTATPPIAPTRDGYVFAGWYTDAELTTLYDFSTPVAEDFILYAKWNPAVSGLVCDANGTYYYYLNGEVQTSYTGLVEYAGTFFYVENGVLNWNYTGLAYYEGIYFYVENGMLNWNYTGLAYYAGTYFYIENGMLNWDYTGLSYYAGTYFYVENGMLNWNYTGLSYYNGLYFYVENGMLNWNYTGLAILGNNFFYIENGILNWDYTGLAYYSGIYFYIENGMLNWDFYGFTNYAGVWFYIEGGMLTWNFNGYIYDAQGNAYYVVGSIVQM